MSTFWGPRDNERTDALRECANTLEAAERERDTALARLAEMKQALDKAKRDFTLAADWMKSMLPEMECRNDEDCDHCLGLQIVNDWPVNAETEYQSELSTALDRLAEVERERDQVIQQRNSEARVHRETENALFCDAREARAQVATLAEALRTYAKQPNGVGEIARAALKAAGVEP